MGYIVITAWYPSHLGTELGKKYLEVMKKYPPSKNPGKDIIPVMVTTTKKGIKVMSITEYKDDDPQMFADVMNWANINMVEYMNIEGFEYKTRIWGSIQASMELIGLKMP
ncbi:MAG: hypothetical protein ACFFDN_30450 [Candidatus Hodarchaeota archaeon]